jgi:bifunctional UDP-N-acetylglucosamine pyrophosphorylase/glucosamine-1-phosphate N-acetyltransferase
MAVVPVKTPQHFGMVQVEDEYVTGITEKPREEGPADCLANAGMYIFPKTIFKDIATTKLSPRAEFEITDTIQSLLMRKVPIVSIKIDPNSWLDLGKPWDLLEANERLLNHTNLEIKGRVEKGATILGNVGVEEGTRIRSGAYIEGPVFIGSNCDIGPNCYIRPFTSIGNNVRIGNACEIKASIIFDRTHINHLSYVGDSIVGENCNLGAGTITANLRLDDGTVKVKLKSEVLDSYRKKLGTFIGDNVKTGVNVNIMPGVKLAPNVWIGPNVTIYEDVGENKKVFQRQDLHFLDQTPT